MQQGTPQGYPQTPAGSAAPGVAPSDRPARPGPSQAYTSGAVPTLNQLSPGQPSFATNRPSTTSSHSYSRSSPGAKYVPFSPSNPPETPQYSGQKYYSPHTPTGALSQSPLVLADIRGGMMGMDSELLSPDPYRDAAGIQSPSSYLAPWPIYASDWCNWSVSPGHGAGKMAICSYLEDPHNFVSHMIARRKQGRLWLTRSRYTRSRYLTRRSNCKRREHQDRLSMVSNSSE